MPDSIRPTETTAGATAGVKRVINQLYTNDGALIVEPVTGSQVALGDVDGQTISLASVVRTLELILQELRLTNVLLFSLKEPGTVQDLPRTFGADIR